jgi:hypothetical protein
MVKQVEKRNTLDSLVYWGAQIVLVTLAAAGMTYLCQPTSVVIVYPLTFVILSACVYISHRNR